MEIFTKNSAKCTIFQRSNCNNFLSLMKARGLMLYMLVYNPNVMIYWIVLVVDVT
jgi:hypothetical protein